ncbi:MAG TPA: M28 family peptidase [Edaphobacter sp.]|uniref:M28 family peptidase n=1 Tax=Edaphobacter sp. TaxID=1934404 RepID=UPI002C3272B0|nr:M28 family peptidase [Edaphobacter sp.]HUZ95293.1 M28 family peptidase [Edaphobacter sp.]
MTSAALVNTCHPERSAAKPKDLRLLLPLLVLLLTAANARAAAPARFNGQAAYALTQQYLNVAPKRYIGSPGHAKAEAFIEEHFKPEIAKGHFETDSFAASTPVGLLDMRNYIVKYPGKKDGVIVIASHYETNYPLRDISFVGANDGAATSALLIEIGNYLRVHPPQGYSVWLVFDDGEEAIANPPYNPSQWTSSNSLYGTRHLAAKWSQDGTLKKIKAFMVADMIGDKDLNIDKDANSTPWLLDLLQQAAKNTGHSSYVFKNQTAVDDDHIPFQQRGVPVLDIIDMDYGPHTMMLPDGYHHTAFDTIDKISAHSLQIAGDLFLEMIRLIDQHG